MCARRCRGAFHARRYPSPDRKIQALSAERIAEVEDFIDFIRLREQQRLLARAAAAASEPAFAAVWSNPDDEAYDAL